jgi:F-type H+-transporting ATPase subunit b
MGDIFGNLGIIPGQLIFQILSFIILFVVVRAWVVKPLMGVLDRRKKTIAQGLEDARVAGEARANAESEAARITAEANSRAAEIVRDATERAEASAREVRADAEREIAATRESAMEDMTGERNRMLGELRDQVVTLALAVAEKLIGESLDDERHHELLQEILTGLSSGRIAVLEAVPSVSLDGAAVEVTSALPLTSEEQEAVRRDIVERAGNAASITFRADPSILGGLVIRIGDHVIDGSLAGQLQTMRTSLAV